MSALPLPDKIDGFRSGVINDIIDYLRSLSPIASRGVWHQWTPQGVTTFVRDAGGTNERAMPFDVAGVAWAGTPSVPTVTLVEGDIEIHGESLAGTTTTYKTVSPLTVTLTGSGTEYVYAQVTWSGSAWGTPTLAKGASKPNDAADTYRKLLWKFVAGVPMVQYHRGNIEAVGLRMQA